MVKMRRALVFRRRSCLYQNDVSCHTLESASRDPTELLVVPRLCRPFSAAIAISKGEQEGRGLPLESLFSFRKCGNGEVVPAPERLYI